MGFRLDVDESLCTWDADDNPGGLLCDLEDGWLFLTRAAQILDLLGSDHGETLRRMMREELSPAGEDPAYLAPSQVRRLLDLLDGLPEAAEGTLVDENWQLLPGREASGLGSSTTDAGGRPVVSLARVLSEIGFARRFFEGALRLECFVIVE